MGTPITFPMVFDRLGIPYTVRGANTLVRCPKCGKLKFYFDVRKNVGHCYRASCDLKGSALGVYAEVTGLSKKDAVKEILGGLEPSYTPKVYEFKESAPVAPTAARNAAYRKLLAMSPLSARHKRDLEKRGIKVADIERFGYGTTTTFDGKAVAGKVLKLMEDGTLKGVAGFYKDQEGCWTLNQRTKGILVPYVNQRKEITGFQIRKNEEDRRSKDDGKYICLSSNGKEEGSKTQLCVHFACDFAQDFLTGNHYPLLSKSVRLTEGAMKADIAHYVTGESILAVAGVNNLESSGFKNTLEYLKKRGVTTIVDTFDMDFISNADVQTAMEKLKKLVLRAGLEYKRIDWDPEYKGYDDYVVAMRDQCEAERSQDER